MGTLSVAVVRPRPSKKRESTHETRSTPPGLLGGVPRTNERTNGGGKKEERGLTIGPVHSCPLATDQRPPRTRPALGLQKPAHLRERAEMATRMAAPPASRRRCRRGGCRPFPSPLAASSSPSSSSSSSCCCQTTGSAHSQPRPRERRSTEGVKDGRRGTAALACGGGGG